MKTLLKSDKSKYILIFLLYFLVPFILYGNLLVNEQVFVSGDGLSYFSLKEIMKNVVMDGEFPLWNKYLENGIPYIGDLNSVFYPLIWICLMIPSWLQMYVYFGLHIGIGAFFTFLFLKEHKVSNINAFFSGLIYATSIGLNGYRKEHIGILVVIIYLPVVLFFLERFMNTFKYKYLFFSSIALALSFLACFPQHQLYMDVCVFFYLVAGLLYRKRKIKEIIKSVLLWGMAFVGLITCQLFGTFELLTNYSSSVSTPMSYEEFTSFSIAPIKLLMVFFPNIFNGQIFDSLGVYKSSGIDIELYAGITVAFISLAGILFIKKKFVFILSGCMMLGSLMYASVASIPIIGKIIYHVPAFGSFRCPARILFIFTFFLIMIYSISLEQLINKYLEGKWIKKLLLMIGGLTLFCIVSIPIVAKTMQITELSIYIGMFRQVLSEYFIGLGMIIGIGFVVLILQKKTKISELNIRNIAFALLGLSVILQVLPYTLDSHSIPNTLVANEDELEYYELIQENVGNGKVLVADNALGGASETLFSVQKGIYYQIPVINAYIPFNNPKLYKLLSPNGVVGARQNLTGLYTGFEEIDRNLEEDNDILSMLGISILVDPLELINDDGTVITGYEENNVLTENEDAIAMTNNDQDLMLTYLPVQVESNEDYIITFEIVNNSDREIETVADLCGENYDFAEQDFAIKLKPGKNVLKKIVNTGEIPLNTAVNLRLYTYEQCDLNIEKLQLSTINPIIEQLYEPIIIDDKQRIFRNLGAEDIFSSAKTIINIESNEQIYTEPQNLDFKENTYIVDGKTDDITEATITNIVWKNNSATAKVQVEEKTALVKFASNYFPGWKAYVDGKETKVYEVNGIIQGIYVDKGEHVIEFKYVPTIVYLGIMVTVITLVIIFVYIIYEHKKNKKM